MITAIIPVVLALVGAALHTCLQANPKVQELGRLLFAAGVFALAFALSTYKFSL